ncbi:MAG: hypothetical protein R6U36_04505 [Candidatus Fermentibacteraceae bacterium]
MAALGKASRVLFPLAVAAFALSLAIVSGREASRHIGGESPSLEVLSSGLDQIRGFIGDVIYLKIDAYHHIWMYQGHGWAEATDYLPMVWLVSRLKPGYTQNYIDGGYHLAVNLGRVEEGIDFLRRGIRMCPDDPGLAWEYAVVLWRTEYGDPEMRRRAFRSYLRLVRRRRGETDAPWNEPNALMILGNLYENGIDKRAGRRISRLYHTFADNMRALRRVRRGLDRPTPPQR